MKRLILSLLLAGFSAVAGAEKKAADPIAPFVKKAGDTVEDLRKKAVAEIDKQRAPAEKPKPQIKKKTPAPTPEKKAVKKTPVPAEKPKPSVARKETAETTATRPEPTQPKTPSAEKPTEGTAPMDETAAEKPEPTTSPKPYPTSSAAALREAKKSATKSPPQTGSPPAADSTSAAPKEIAKAGDGKPIVVPKPTPETPAPEVQTEGPAAGKKSPHGPPAIIPTTDLADFDTLPADRRKLIENALQVAKESPWLPYKYGGSSPAEGGFDCSGAMCFVMNKAGLKPPRTSANQYEWLKENNRLHEVPADVRTLDHSSLSALRPGDLLFWSGTYAPTDGRTVDITHVAMYLGKEKKGGRHVMINATDGRSYRGRQANGYGVYDFYLPKDGGKSKFVGFGTPPGIAEIPMEAPPGKVTSP